MLLSRRSAPVAAAILLLLLGSTAAEAHNPEAESLYDGGFSALDINGREVSLSELQGKVTVIVNVASKCGFTDANYKALQESYAKYAEFGVEVLAFPCNQFGAQEPGDAAAISSFVAEKYAVTFRMMDKVEVNGPQQHPVFAWLKANAPAASGKQQGADIAWNFEKFLLDKRGRAIGRFSSDMSELDVHELETAIYKELLKEEEHGEL